MRRGGSLGSGRCAQDASGGRGSSGDGGDDGGGSESGGALLSVAHTGHSTVSNAALKRRSSAQRAHSSERAGNDERSASCAWLLLLRRARSSAPQEGHCCSSTRACSSSRRAHAAQLLSTHCVILIATRARARRGARVFMRRCARYAQRIARARRAAAVRYLEVAKRCSNELAPPAALRVNICRRFACTRAVSHRFKNIALALCAFSQRAPHRSLTTLIPPSTTMAFVSAVPLSAAPRASAARCALSRSAFVARPLRAVAPRAAAAVVAPRMEFEISEGIEFDLNPIVFALAFFGWVIPSSIPAGIPLTNGTGLSQAFFASIQDNLARWPKGPAIDDPFWLLFTLWHVGMFATLIFGTIGYNLRKNPSS